MSVVRFGTDGIRGTVGVEVTPEIVAALARAAAELLGGEGFLLARDPRSSGRALTEAAAAGITAADREFTYLGVLPTPALALAARTRAVPGIMITASHNPAADNGLKIFDRDGRKLARLLQEEITDRAGALLGAELHVAGLPPRDDDAGDAYAELLAARLPAPLPLRVVLDAANGAAAEAALRVLTGRVELVATLGVAPDGHNINLGCGATHLDALRRAVREHRADLGLALDGDGDRLIAVDAEGGVVDGDDILLLLALDRRDRGALPGEGVVCTTWTNPGVLEALGAHGITVHRSGVGDQAVMARCLEVGSVLGGESSGHVLQLDLAPGGDGLLAACELLRVLGERNRPLADLLAAARTRTPAAAVEIPVTDPRALVEEITPLLAARTLPSGVDELVRASGTERLVRLRVHAPTELECDERLAELSALVHAAQRAHTPPVS